MQIKRNIALSDSGFIFDPSTGDSFSTNPIGLEIIRMLKAGTSHADIRTSIVKTYMTDEATFEKDLYDFVSMISKLKLSEQDEKEKD